MQEAGTITIISNKQEVVLNISQILYVQMKGNFAFIHVSSDLEIGRASCRERV